MGELESEVQHEISRPKFGASPTWHLRVQRALYRGAQFERESPRLHVGNERVRSPGTLDYSGEDDGAQRLQTFVFFLFRSRRNSFGFMEDSFKIWRAETGAKSGALHSKSANFLMRLIGEIRELSPQLKTRYVQNQLLFAWTSPGIVLLHFLSFLGMWRLSLVLLYYITQCPPDVAVFGLVL